MSSRSEKIDRALRAALEVHDKTEYQTNGDYAAMDDALSKIRAALAPGVPDAPPKSDWQRKYELLAAEVIPFEDRAAEGRACALVIEHAEPVQDHATVLHVPRWCVEECDKALKIKQPYFNPQPDALAEAREALNRILDIFLGLDGGIQARVPQTLFIALAAEATRRAKQERGEG